jgi:hypothetical protein
MKPLNKRCKCQQNVAPFWKVDHAHHWLMSNKHQAKALRGKPRAEAAEFSKGMWKKHWMTTVPQEWPFCFSAGHSMHTLLDVHRCAMVEQVIAVAACARSPSVIGFNWKFDRVPVSNRSSIRGHWKLLLS